LYFRMKGHGVLREPLEHPWWEDKDMLNMKWTSIGFPAGVLVLVIGLFGLANAADLVVSGADGRTGLDVTVYNQDLALVREVRKVVLPQGLFTLEFRDVPSRINPVTLMVAGGGRSGFELLEQNYEFDLISPDKILEKYVGQSLSWIQEDGSRIEGTLLSVTNGPVYEVGEEIVFKVPGRLALPTMPANLRARPTLVWLAQAKKSGEAELETSYLTKGISWTADYVLQLDAAGTTADLQAWVTVNNRCGAAFAEANLLLVAGDLNQAQPTREHMVMATAYLADAEKGFVEETLYDYHLYTLQRPTTIKDNQIKQISLYEADGLKVVKHYRLGGHPHLFRSLGRMTDKPRVEVSYSFANAKSNNMGMPLPAGVVRVYGTSSSGSRQLLGEDRIDHTPKDETIELTVGKAFDIVADRVRTDARKLADNLYRTTFEITLRNHRDEDVTVEIIEQVGGYWEVVESSIEPRKVDAQTLGFDVPVKADGETVLRYTVEVKY
jgi:hypothetical protein